ncbi:MAG: molybdenum cofactor guanylyltransferase MobA [Candidatus Dactylopiibacterium sp.]|nr:molybdenum cofactor guanylyltransferase MobA [Candidatus Dactylopiibacterium sp.]
MGITGVILAGGAGRRMGGLDKGLVDFGGRPLVSCVVDALAPQVDELLIVANRNLERYRAYGHRVVCDLRPGFAGPLAGLEAALAHATHEQVLTCPTDVPGLPPDYALRMLAAGRAAAVAQIDAQWQPVFCLLPRAAGSSLREALESGERKLMRWLATQAPVAVPFDDCAACLRDADSPEELAALLRPAR